MVDVDVGFSRVFQVATPRNDSCGLRPQNSIWLATMINTLTNLLTLNMYVVYVRWKTCIISFTLSKILMCISIHLPIVSTYCIYLLCLPIVSIYCIYLLYLSIVSIHPSICQTEVFSHAHVLLGIFLPLRWLAGVGIADCTGPRCRGGVLDTDIYLRHIQSLVKYDRNHLCNIYANPQEKMTDCSILNSTRRVG